MAKKKSRPDGRSKPIPSRSTGTGKQKEYSPEKIVKALAAVCKRRKVAWPLKFPTPHNITIEAQDYGFYMEICSTLSSSLGWTGLREFIYEVTGSKSFERDWTDSYREALRLAMLGLGLNGDSFFEKGDGKSPIPNRLKVYELWGIDPKQIKLNEDKAMAKKSAAVVRKNAPVNEPAAKTGRTSSKDESSSNTPKSAPTKSLKPAKAGAAELPEQTFGGLEMAGAFLAAMADYAGQASKEAPADERVKELADVLAQASKLLDKIVGA